MLSFKSFIEEVSKTKRKNMVHLEKMKDVEFVKFIQKVQNELKGKLKNINVSLKVDGLGFRFGKDSNGRPFVEGSRTGPIFEPKSFSNYVKSKGKDGVMLQRAYHYDDLYDIFINSNLMRVLPNNTKVVCEVLYNPMGDYTDEGISFVKVAYDRNKLGNIMTVVPISVLDSDTNASHPSERQILDRLYNQSNNDIKIIDPSLNVSSDIDISGVISPIKSLDDEVIRILQSRKKVDKPAKESYKNIIANVKNQLARYLIKNEKIKGSDKLGPEMEGLVFEIGDQLVKVTSDEFKMKMKS